MISPRAASPIASNKLLAGAGLILASASPRRVELLGRLGVNPSAILSADIDETPHAAELPRPYAARMAREKAQAIAALHPGQFVLAGDTVVACGRRILPKAEDEATARQCLALLSGRRHRVLSAIALIGPDGRLREAVSETILKVKRLNTAEIERYIASGEWHGKAGGYAIQGAAEGFVPWLSGSHSGVMGLPLYETRQLLIAGGFSLG